MSLTNGNEVSFGSYFAVLVLAAAVMVVVMGATSGSALAALVERAGEVRPVAKNAHDIYNHMKLEEKAICNTSTCTS